MVSRSRKATPLLTLAGIMRLPPADEIIMVADRSPIREKKACYLEDAGFQKRDFLPPALAAEPGGGKLPVTAQPASDLAPITGGGLDDNPAGSQRLSVSLEP